MANCRIQNLTPTCGYNGDGVVSVMLLDFEDFLGFTFQGLASYASCYVETIQHVGAFVTVDLPDFPAQYTGTLNEGLYGHSLEAFIAELSAPILADLHLATKRPQLVVFKTRTGRYFAFGHDMGAKATYSAQTADNTGAVLTLAASSQYPLFEVAPDAIIETTYPFTWRVMWDGAICELDERNFFNPANLIDGRSLSADTPTQLTVFAQAGSVLAFAALPSGQYTVQGFPVNSVGFRSGFSDALTVGTTVVRNTATTFNFPADKTYFVFSVKNGDNPMLDLSAIKITDGSDGFTGMTQAVLAVKVSPIDGQPLDEDNMPTFVSGKQQAALKLINTEDPEGYDVVGTFNRREAVNGEPTTQYDPINCGEGGDVPWILTTGFWDNNAFWINTGIWNY